MIEYDIAVIGAGYAGRIAAAAAVESGAQTIIIDEHAIDASELPRSNLLTQLPRTTVWGLFAGFQIGIAVADGQSMIAAKRVILATGATEMTFSFPGSDLPGVMTGRGLMSMLNEHRVWPGGRRVAIVGWSDEAEELAETIDNCGGDLVFWASDPETEVEAFAKDGVVTGVRVNDEEFQVDLIAISIGEQPDIALASMMECEIGFSDELGGFTPKRSDRMETSVSGLFICGSAAGIGWMDEFAYESRVAGRAAAHSLGLITDEELAEEIADFAEAFPDRVDAGAAIEMTWAQHDANRSTATNIAEFSNG